MTDWALDRETVIMRVYAAPRSAVFAAFTDPDAMCQWYGPDGFQCIVHEMNTTVGGRSRFDLIAPDGTLYPNRVDYLQVVPDRLLEYHHGSDIDNDPAMFHVTITFDEQANGKTVLTMRQLHATPERRNEVIGFGAVELGLQTLNKLAAYLGC
ncbi:MAG: SRPBCC family protein [Actinomycetota bacterium]|nr:SRPBCC family protein [Actinomycetota bacterium]